MMEAIRTVLAACDIAARTWASCSNFHHTGLQPHQAHIKAAPQIHLQLRACSARAKALLRAGRSTALAQDKEK